MRIVHTSDWHAGRIWKGLNRLSELEAVLNHLAGFLERERIQLLLVSGDVFDSHHPSAEAERLVFEFFKRVGQVGVQSVVIAGNHDHPERVEAWGTLAELVGVRTLGRPKSRARGGLVEVAVSGEQALIAAVPFARVGHLVTAMDLASEEQVAVQRYADGMRGIFAHLASGFSAHAINLLMAHTHISGAVLATHDRSERSVHLGDDWAVTPQAIPATAQYVALGHIHKPQRMDAAPVPTYYGGSPMQLDFGEAGEEKTFVVLEASAGKPVRIQHVPYEGAKPLVDVRLSLDDLEREAPRLKDAGYLRVTVPVTTPDPEIHRTVRALLPNAVAVPVEAPEVPVNAIDQPAAGSPPRALFAAYFTREHGVVPTDALLVEFDRLHDAVLQE